MTDLLRLLNIISNLMMRIFDMSAELDTVKAELADQAIVIADQSAKIDSLLAIPRADPADVATIAEIATAVASNGAALSANTAKINAALTPVA